MVFESLIGIYTQPPPPLHTYYHIRALGDVFANSFKNRYNHLIATNLQGRGAEDNLSSIPAMLLCYSSF